MMARYGNDGLHFRLKSIFEPMVDNQIPFLVCLVIREVNILELKVIKNYTNGSLQSLHLKCSTQKKALVTLLLTRKSRLICTKNYHLHSERNSIHQENYDVNLLSEEFH